MNKEETRAKINYDEICIKGIDEVPMFSWNTKTKEFYVLGHKFDGVNSIEDFINYITDLDKENKQLKDNWNKLKEIIDVKMYNSEYLINLCGYKVDVDTLEILKIIKEEMQELEGENNGT